MDVEFLHELNPQNTKKVTHTSQQHKHMKDGVVIGKFFHGVKNSSNGIKYPTCK